MYPNASELNGWSTQPQNRVFVACMNTRVCGDAVDFLHLHQSLYKECDDRQFLLYKKVDNLRGTDVHLHRCASLMAHASLA
jgi:hypothetical protein